jgi:hypothetical protein
MTGVLLATGAPVSDVILPCVCPLFWSRIGVGVFMSSDDPCSNSDCRVWRSAAWAVLLQCFDSGSQVGPIHCFAIVVRLVVGTFPGFVHLAVGRRDLAPVFGSVGSVVTAPHCVEVRRHAVTDFQIGSRLSLCLLSVLLLQHGQKMQGCR